MKKVILIPDSFKGTLSSQQIIEVMRSEILGHYPDAEIVSIPVADGGEGTVNSLLTAVGGTKVALRVKDPYMNDCESFYGIIHDGKTAVIEMAAAAGLPLVKDRLNPVETTTYGVGQLIKHAVLSGCKTIIVGLGGSATNDFGVGAAAAMGVRFLDSEGHEFIPVGGTLSDISKIDMSGLLPSIKNVNIITMCDINNPLYGENGAAHVYGPQKGATQAMVELLDKQLMAIAKRVALDLNIDIAHLPGAGAAGGMGGGMVTFFDSSLEMGIETVLNIVGFDQLLEDADYVFTGEGQLDRQSFMGKVINGISKRTSKKNVPLIAVVGSIDNDVSEAYDMGVSAIFSINLKPIPFEIAKDLSLENLKFTMHNIVNLIKTIECQYKK